MKISRVICFLLLCIITLEMVSCAKLDSSQDVPSKDRLNERIFLSASMEGGTATSGFPDSTTHGVYVGKSSEVFEDMLNKTKTLSFNKDKKFTYESSNFTYKTSQSQERGTFYSVYDLYRSEKEEIMYLRGTDLLCFYYVSGGGIEDISLTSYSKDAAKSAADTFLLKFLTKEKLKDFDKITIDDTSKVFSYTVQYTRSIEGYETDEELWLFFDKDGKLNGYNGYNLSKYDNLADSITKEKLDAAKEALLEKLSASEKTDFQYEEPKITTDTSGNVYLEIQYSYIIDGSDVRNAEIALVSVI